MTAIGVTTYGGPDALHEIEVRPEPLGPSDVRLRVTAAAVNPTDTGVRSGVRDHRQSPEAPGAVPGMERGADFVVPRGAGFAGAVRERYPDGVDGLADGALLNEVAIAAVKDGGRMVTLRGWDGGDQDRVTVLPVLVRNHVLEWEALDRPRELAESGVLTVRVAEVLPAEQAAEAHRQLEAGGVRGRLVLQF